MREFVGVKSPLDLAIEVASKRLPVENVFKREALMFGRIACPQLGQVVSVFEKFGSIAQPISDQFCAHVDYLKQQGVIFDDVSSADGPELDFLMSDEEFRGLANLDNKVGPWILHAIHDAGLERVLKRPDVTVEEMLPHLDQVPAVIGPMVVALQLVIRKISIQLRILDRMDAYPVFSETVPPIPLQVPHRCDVIDVAINALPVPDDTVSWEHIIEFRSDPDSQTKFLALRNWMNEVARAELSPAEIEVKLEYLIAEYQQHMRVHRMKSNVGGLQTLLVAAGNILDRKFAEAARTLFSATPRSLSLLEGELTSPGKEVAFIVNARERFGASANHGSIK